MAEPIVKIYSPSQFNQLLTMFQSAVDCGEYTEKIPYGIWRMLKKMSGDIKVEYSSSFVKIVRLTYNSRREEVETIIFSTKACDNGFGRFFYNYVIKEREKMENETVSNVASDYATAYVDTKADECTGKISNIVDSTSLTWTGSGCATTTTSTAVPNYVDSVSGWTNINLDEIQHKLDKLEEKLSKKENIEDIKKNNKKESNSMIKGVNFDFGPCGNTVRLSMYGMAIQNVAGEWVSYNPESREIINVDVFNIADGGKYMYKMPVAISDVAVGDIVIHNRVPMFVTAVNKNGTFEVTDIRAGEAKTIIPSRSPFGFNFIIKVVSLFSAFTNAPTADQPFGNMLPLMMLGDNKDIDPVMLMFMMNQKDNNMFSNPMMMYFLIKDNEHVDPLVLMMMMNTCSCEIKANMIKDKVE